MTGAAIASEIAKALREAATATGDGPLTAIIRRAGPTTGPEYDPVPGAPIEFEVACLDGLIQLRDGAGMLTGEVQRVLTIEAGDVVPAKGDTIIIRGVSHRIGEVKPLAPGGVDLLYKVQLDG